MTLRGATRIAVAAIVAARAAVAAAAAAEERPPVSRVGIVRARLATPQIVSGALSGLFFREPAGFDCSIFCDMRGVQVQADAGPGGGSIGVGWASLVGERTRSGRFVRAVYLGFGARAVVLRTWGEADFDPVERTYAGIEGAFTITQVSMTLGFYRRIVSGADEADWKWFGGLGWGF